MTGGEAKLDINMTMPDKTLVPGSHLDPGQPARVLASVVDGQPQVVPDFKAKAVPKLPPPHKGVHLPHLPVVVLVFKRLRLTAAFVRAQLQREIAVFAEEVEEPIVVVHVRAGDRACQR